ncbi:hypothetical protein C0995_009068 [Termitomyces sp. Mi166|nr:hypothetical protein C0995_009068 [Termitomyces sp. Mi166\
MGCVQSSEAGTDNAVDLLAPKDNASASVRRRRIYNDQRQDIKILLLGAKDSGKSTILKQMKLMYWRDFTLDEREIYREIILANIIDSMKAVLDAIPGLNLQISPENQAHAIEILNTSSYLMPLSPWVSEAICVLSKDPMIKNESQLHDNASYYFESAERICSAKYLPTNQDILRSRVTTTGISKTSFTVERFILNVFDCGGSRSERRKWVHCFGDTDVIIFLASMSEYDQELLEDSNQFDIFAAKLLHSPLEDHFSKYKGGQDYDAACDYIQNSCADLHE